MNDSVAAMLDLLRSDRELRRHVSDAAMAEQLAPPDDAKWLASCVKVKEARAQMKVADDVSTR